MARNRKKGTLLLFGSGEEMTINSYNYWYQNLYGLALNRWRWNLPDSCDPLYLEKCLLQKGSGVFAYDNVLDKFVSLDFMGRQSYDIYGYPNAGYAVGWNGSYKLEFDEYSGVVIFNNLFKSSDIPLLKYHAARLANIDMTMYVNVHGQKRPRIVITDEQTRLSYENALKKIDDNETTVFVTKDYMPTGKDANGKIADNLEIAPTFIARELFDILRDYISTALTDLGISSEPESKQSARLTLGESSGQYETVLMKRTQGLYMRQLACKKINNKFKSMGMEVSVEYNQSADIISMMTDYFSAMSRAQAGNIDSGSESEQEEDL